MARNLLDQETSPYLLQHRNNPVHWRPWGPEALAAARAEDKPILLSVGYAACHWCHVMAHESFEDPAIAQVMNDHFIPVKVDREERPDIDILYQTALALLGGRGGWPLTMFLTPEGEPFWGGTYFPPTARYGLPSFRQVLEHLAAGYRDKSDKIAGNVAALSDALARQLRPQAGAPPDRAAIDGYAETILAMVDDRDGGLAGAPKFPQGSLFTFLWRAGLRSGRTAFTDAVTLTLDHMSQGGIYDHLAGGFARYSTDDHWLVPHFEKMLYDNADLIDLLTLVWQRNRSPLYARRVAECIDWLATEMIAEHGAFAATLDADSEGEEGKYYVWSAAEIRRLLTADQAELFCRTYGVTSGGNWEGRCILHRNHADGAFDPALEPPLEPARRLLLAERRRRQPPGRDDKVLADWNGMMITALANAAFAFSRPDWLDLARTAFAAVREHLGRPGQRLSHSLRLDRVQAEAMLDDYAQMARAALALFETTGESAYLQQAEDWAGVAEAHYWDHQDGGYFLTADDADALILRSKPAHDHATPAGNGAMVAVLARLFHHTGDDRYRARAEQVLAAFGGDLDRGFASMTSLLQGAELLDNAQQIVVVGPPDDPATLALIDAVAGASLPNRVLSLLSPGQTLQPGHPAAAKVTARARPVAFLCQGPVCSLPIDDAEALRQALASL